MTGRDCIERTLRGEATERLAFMPITMMFAADLVGVPYRVYATDYRELVRGQLAVAERFGASHVSCISDPCREAADCGARLQWFDGQPPAVDEANALLAEKAALGSLTMPDPANAPRMADRLAACQALHAEAGAALMVEGWVEGPCAEAADLRGINRLMMDFFEDEGFAAGLLDFCTELAIAFARAQLHAGARLIGIGDAAASLIGPAVYERFVLPRQQRLVGAIHDAGGLTRLHICGNIEPVLPMVARVGASMVDLDSMVPMDAGRAAMPDTPLLGNIDPVRVLRNGDPDLVARALGQCRRLAGPPYIVGAGCEVPRGTPPENLQAMAAFACADSEHAVTH